MSQPFDLRHRWSEPTQRGALITRTCSACGITRSMEVLVPNALLEAVYANVRRPNPYRALIR